MKIAIVSMQRIVNNGSYLQAYALRETLSKLSGASVGFLDFENGIHIKEEAKQKEIKTQISISGGGTGTNTPAVNLTREGIPCVDVGLPLKSMHTCTEVLELSDAESVASLVALFVSSKNIAEVFAR